MSRSITVDVLWLKSLSFVFDAGSLQYVEAQYVLSGDGEVIPKSRRWPASAFSDTDNERMKAVAAKVLGRVRSDERLA